MCICYNEDYLDDWRNFSTVCHLDNSMLSVLLSCYCSLHYSYVRDCPNLGNIHLECHAYTFKYNLP